MAAAFLGKARQHRAAVILAGGEGTRLASVTRRIAGRAIPKQFCEVLGGLTMLEMTARRVELSIAGPQVLTVVTGHHRHLYQPLAATVPCGNLIVQPEGRGTAPAILYATLKLAHLIPDCILGIFPSDHYVNDDKLFMDRVESAFDFVEAYPDWVVLLGIEPTAPETQYGWIEPGEQIRGTECPNKGVRRIERFWEKPSQVVAERLYKRQCLWNSFVIVSGINTLLNLCAEAVPELYTRFTAIQPIIGTGSEPKAIELLYATVPSTSFSDAVLVNCFQRIAVMPVSGLRWVDLGEPGRLLSVMNQGQGVPPALVDSEITTLSESKSLNLRGLLHKPSSVIPPETGGGQPTLALSR